MYDYPFQPNWGVNEALAQTEKTITSTFKDKDLNTDEEGANIWTADNAAKSKEARGVQFLNSARETKLTSTKSISNITKVEVVCQTNNTSKPVVEIAVGENTIGSLELAAKGTEYTVTGKPTSATSGIITITLNKGKKATANSIYVKSITVYYNEGGETPDTPKECTFSINPATINVEAGQTAEATVETNYDGTIAVTSDNETIAEAIYESGTLLVEGKAEGTATITLTGTGSTTYKDFTKTVAVNVTAATTVEPDPTPGGESKVLFLETFGNATQQTAVKDYIGYKAYSVYFTTGSITGNISGQGKVYKKSNTASVNSNGYEGASGESSVVGAGGTNVTENIIKIDNINIAQYENLQLSFGYRHDDGTETTNVIKVEYQIDNGTSKSLDVDFTKTGTWNFFDKALEGEGTSLSLTFVHVTTKGYKARLDDIKVTGTKKAEPTSYTLNIGSTGYSTLCLDKAYTMPEGLHGAVVSVEDKVLTVDYMYEANDIVAAGMPLLIKADEAKDYTLVYSTETGTDRSSETMMSGKVDASGMTAGEAGSKFYKLAAPNGVLGFYWGATDGGAFKNGENKAYLVVPADVAMSVQGFRLDGQTTGIGSAETGGEAARAIYGIDGRRINGQLNELPRGIYIVNGKKVIK